MLKDPNSRQTNGGGAGGGADASNVLARTRDYLARGWSPVPVPFKQKKPSAGDEWHLLIITTANVEQYFIGQRNVGVKMGAESHGLTDVDLDSREAVAMAPFFLPPTGAKFGRASARRAHWLYITTLATTCDKAQLQYEDTTPEGKAKGDKAMLVELRIGGAGKASQTVFPGSVHQSGELIEWDEDGEPPSFASLATSRRPPFCSTTSRRYSRASRH